MQVGGSASETTANYRYTYHGFTYENSLVYVAAFNDSIGSYQKNLRKNLAKSYTSKHPITIWLDPDNPEKAIIDKDMRWGLLVLMSLFCSLFIGIGLTVSWLSLTTKSTSSLPSNNLQVLHKKWLKRNIHGENKESFSEYRRKALNHKAGQRDSLNTSIQAIWKEKPEWADSQIRSEAKSSSRVMWGMAILWNLISLPALFAFQDELHKGNYLILIALVFPLTGIYLLYKSFTIGREYRRFGDVKLSLDPYPGSIGGHVGGSLEIPEKFTDAKAFTVELNCIYSYISGSGDSRRRHEDIKWGESGSPELKMISSGTRQSFRFNIPDFFTRIRYCP